MDVLGTHICHERVGNIQMYIPVCERNLCLQAWWLCTTLFKEKGCPLPVKLKAESRKGVGFQYT